MRGEFIKWWSLVFLVGAVVWGILNAALWPFDTADASGGKLTGHRSVFLKQTATPGQQDVVIFSDDFSTYSNRWQLQESPKALIVYREGTLYMNVTSPGVSVWSLPDFHVPLVDYTADVTIDLRDGSPDSMAGFVLNFEAEDSFLTFVTTAQGDWRVFHHSGPDWVDMTPAEHVSAVQKATDSPLWLRVKSTGDVLTFVIDGQVVGELSQMGLPTGEFGLVALAGKGFIDVAFDDVIVTVSPEAR
ncbi:MAG: hypothetical protein JW966_14780 [Anaerolineae bacterium]|nr:hypothetical protein [Anaerolineae bacterium]